MNEDATSEPEPRYSLPDRASPYYEAAAARALLDGANVGNTLSAEKATGYRWGDPALVSYIEELAEEAAGLDDERTVRLARRYLRKARAG